MMRRALLNIAEDRATRDCAKCIFSEQRESGLFCIHELSWVHKFARRNDAAEYCKLYTTEAEAVAYGRELIQKTEKSVAELKRLSRRVLARVRGEE